MRRIVQIIVQPISRTRRILQAVTVHFVCGCRSLAEVIRYALDIPFQFVRTFGHISKRLDKFVSVALDLNDDGAICCHDVTPF